MRTQSIENIKSYTTAATLGVVGGYALKHAMPLSEYEREEFFTPAVIDSLRNIENSAKASEFDSIVIGAREGIEDVSEDTIKIFKANRVNILENKAEDLLENISNYDKHAKEAVIKLARRVQQSGLDAKDAQIKNYVALAKQSRPTSYFMLVGSVIMLSFAVLKNSLFKNMNDGEEYKPLDYIA